MKETEVKKRAWVKNAVIVFLAILVVLTFLSNTIMNRQFPEVAAQHVESGTITARVRGTGTVAANESFEVKLNQTRTVSEVRVRLGDEVSVGDILFTLAGAVSEELDKAEQELHELEVALERKLIDTQLDGDFARENRAIQAIRNRLSDAQGALAAVPGQAALDSAQAAVDRAMDAVAVAASDPDLLAAIEVFENASRAVALAQLAVIALTPSSPGYDEAVATLEVAEAELERANVALSIQRTALINAEMARDQAIANLASLTAAADGRPALEQAVRDIQRELEDAIFELSQKQREGQIGTANIAIDIRELRRQIDEKEDEVETLREEGTGTEITSTVNGLVSSIDISPGNMTNPETPLMVIEVVDRGYSLSFAATAEQAARLTIGDNAEVDRGFFWFDDDVRAVLAGIRNDPQNPVVSRILIFDIIGGVDSGTQLNLTINQRSENYSTIVPNSALRSDTNGDFVLVVDSRPSPLGNRYVAVRADINIITSDDTHTAVSGALAAWDFVITTSSAPVEPGMQVRLADN